MNSKQDYFNVKAISNSSLSYINPEQGGSPISFTNFFKDKQDEEKKYFKMGHLIHKWAEDRDSFIVSSVSKPSDKLGEVADCAEYIIKERRQNLLDEMEANDVQGDITFDKADYENSILEACKIVAWNRTWGDAALIKNAVPPIQPYLEEIQKAENSKKIYLSVKEAEVVGNCVNAVEYHPVAKSLLFMHDTDFSDVVVFSELEIYWNKSFSHASKTEEILLKFKAKLDKLIIDFEKKTITYVDPKTTSKGTYNFMDSFEKYHYYRQQAFYNQAIREFCKQKGYNIEGFTWLNYNIAIETNDLFQCVVYTIPSKWIEKGKKEYQSLIKRILEHEAIGQWKYSLEEVNNNFILELPFKEEV